MNTSIIKRLKKIEIRLNEVLDADLFNVSEAAFDEFQSEVSCFEQDWVTSKSVWIRHRSSLV